MVNWPRAFPALHVSLIILCGLLWGAELAADIIGMGDWSYYLYFFAGS